MSLVIDEVFLPATLTAPPMTDEEFVDFCAQYPELVRESRLPSGFNPTSPGGGWVCEADFGLDQGIVVLMIENHRSRLIWNLLRQCPSIGSGLRRAGFTGGWLS